MQVTNTSNAEHYTWGVVCDGWHLLKSDGLSVIEERVPPGKAEQRHAHNAAQQFFYVLEGVASLEVNGELFQIGPWSGMHVPATVPHQLRNDGQTDLRFLVISQPKSHGDRVNV